MKYPPRRPGGWLRAPVEKCRLPARWWNSQCTSECASCVVRGWHCEWDFKLDRAAY